MCCHLAIYPFAGFFHTLLVSSPSTVLFSAIQMSYIIWEREKKTGTAATRRPSHSKHEMHIQHVRTATSISSCSQVDCTSKCTMCHDLLDECSVDAGRVELSSICIKVQLTPVIHLFVSSESREMDHCPAGYKCWQQAELLIRKGKLAEALSL